MPSDKSNPDNNFSLLNTEEPADGGGIFAQAGAGTITADGFMIPNHVEGGPGMAHQYDDAAEAEDFVVDHGAPGGTPVDGANFAGPVSRTPADAVNDPAYRPIEAATADTMCCRVGPCQFYTELVPGLPRAADDPFDNPDLWRVCRRLHDDEGEISLKDAHVWTCSDFSPPWWSLAGWHRKLINKQRLAQANVTTGGGTIGVIDTASSRLVAAFKALTGAGKDQRNG